MSITNARNFIEKSGCGWITGGALILVMIGGLFTSGQCGGETSETAENRPVVEIARVGEEVVDLNELREISDRQIQSMATNESGVDPKIEGEVYAAMLQSLLGRAVINQVAREKKITVDNAELIKDFESNMDRTILQTKMEMIQQKLIKPDATEAEFASAFKNANGLELADAKKKAKEDFEANLNDPAKRADLAFQALSQKVQGSYSKSITISDADLKKGFDTYTTKRIIAYGFGENEQEARSKIEKAQAELKAGASFESLMNKYTDDPEPSKGKPKSESTIDLQLSVLQYDASLEPIMKLKPGEVSGILPTSSGPAIYKLIKIQNKAPANFESQKAQLREGRLRDMGVRAASDDIRARAAKAQFKSPAAKIMSEWQLAASDPAMRIDRDTLKSKLKELSEALASVEDELMDDRTLGLARYALFSAYYDMLSPTEQKPLQAQKLELLQTVLESAPHIDSFHELAKLAIAAKDGQTAFEALKSAADTNAGTTDVAIGRFKAQNLLRDQLAASKLASTDDLKLLDESLKRWKSDAFEDLKLAAQSNADYSDLGETEYKSQLAKVDRFVQANYIDAAQATEVRAELAKWRTGAFDDLKLQIEGNTDYTEAGEETYKMLQARIQKFAGAGYLSPPQKSELDTLQAKWMAAKKKYDAEQKAKPSGTGTPSGATGGAPSSGDLLKGSTTGN